MKYFIKEGYSRPLMVGKGFAIQFLPVGDDTGVLETENESVIAALRRAESEHRGGIIEVTKEALEEAKKKAGERQKLRNSEKGRRNQQFRVEPTSLDIAATGRNRVTSNHPGQRLSVPERIETAPPDGAASGTEADEAPRPVARKRLKKISATATATEPEASVATMVPA